MPYRTPAPPPPDAAPRASLSQRLGSMTIPIAGLTLVAAVIGLPWWLAVASERSWADRCSRICGALQVPSVIESTQYSCICANPETGRVERFDVDLSNRQVLAPGRP